MNPNGAMSEDLLSAAVAQCADDQFPEDDFLSGVLDGQILTSVADGQGAFATFDANCVADILRDLTEEDGGFQSCSSNNISVRLSDDISLRPLNTSCSANDSAEAFVLPSYAPLESLSAFEGSSAFGAWTLTVTDSEGGNTGVLNSWGIVFNLER